jgi:hypothetical protein
MLESDKAQTAIVVMLMIGAGISGVSLFAVSSFYANTYSLIRSLDVSVESIVIADFDPNSNISEQTPALTITYRMTTGPFSGDVEISRIHSYWYLNNESLVYPQFTRNFQLGTLPLVANFDETVSITRHLEEDVDKLTLLSAYNSSNWQWEGVVQIRYISFTSTGSNVDGSINLPGVTFTGVSGI